MNNRIRVLSILATATMALGTFPASSQARTVLASAGRAQFAADAGCFGLFYSSMTNECATVKRLETALPVDSTGWFTVNMNAQGASSSNNVGCEAVGVDASITSVWRSGIRWLPAFGSAQNLSLTTWVPANGALYVSCDVSPGGRVNTINW